MDNLVLSFVLEPEEVTVERVHEMHKAAIDGLANKPVGARAIVIIAPQEGSTNATVLLNYIKGITGGGKHPILFINDAKLKQYGISREDMFYGPKRELSIRDQKAEEYARERCPFRWSQCEACSDCRFKQVHECIVKDFKAGWDKAMEQNK